MKPLKIFFRISHTGNGKYLKTKNEISNLIVDVIDRNPSKSTTELREIVLNEFKTGEKARQVLTSNSRFFIDSILDVEAIITYLPRELKTEDQFYTQWRFVQKSAAYRLVQYLDDNKLVVYSERTRVIHTVKLDKDIVVVAEEEE